ncbi:MAG: chemotaxis protein [Alphaproteobacteria bacterium]|nr:chemotaxis protein [Alphaproteobacteria bacterium]
MKEPQQFRREQVITIINSVIQKVEAAETVSRETLYGELRGLHDLVEALRSELATRPGEIRGTHIPSATDELDAIVSATAEATGTIMDSCEAIDELTSRADEDLHGRVVDQITKIYEACSFQDITGQRITKVVNTLKIIDEKVEKILDAFGPAEEFKREKQVKDEGPASLLNGPQLPENAISQEDIDRLLAEFD